MIDRKTLSLLYWDLSRLPSVNLQDMLDAVENLVRRVPFRKIVIVADETVMPSKIRVILERPLMADIYVPQSVTFNRFGNNTLHKGEHINKDQLVAHMWGLEQLISIGHKIDQAICITADGKADYTYKDLVTNPNGWFY